MEVKNSKQKDLHIMKCEDFRVLKTFRATHGPISTSSHEYSHSRNKLTQFRTQEWLISNLPCSLTRNITPHNMKNLALHSLLRWKMIILPNSHFYISLWMFERMYFLNLRVKRLFHLLIVKNDIPCFIQRATSYTLEEASVIQDSCFFQEKHSHDGTHSVQQIKHSKSIPQEIGHFWSSLTQLVPLNDLVYSRFLFTLMNLNRNRTETIKPLGN